MQKCQRAGRLFASLSVSQTTMRAVRVNIDVTQKCFAVQLHDVNTWGQWWECKVRLSAKREHHEEACACFWCIPCGVHLVFNFCDSNRVRSSGVSTRADCRSTRRNNPSATRGTPCPEIS